MIVAGITVLVVAMLAIVVLGWQLHDARNHRLVYDHGWRRNRPADLAAAEWLADESRPVDVDPLGVAWAEGPDGATAVDCPVESRSA